MIGSLKGTVACVAADNCIVETAGGVGYRVFMPAAHLAQLAVGREVSVRVHTAVREDAILLYGFLSNEYYELFELLLTVSGVGAKMALGILSAARPDDFYLAVRNKDSKALTALPGVGRKTAERMLLELRDKVGGTAEQPALGGAAAVPDGSPMAEAAAALLSLGYNNAEIAAVVKEIPECGTLTGQDILRRALRLFAGRQ